jgi:putative 4-mercaptohistidine N1-methyltranferase
VNIYESDKLLAEYLLFHYGTPDEMLAGLEGPIEALGYPQRCVSLCLDEARLPADARALDLGCAVGRSTFELARHCVEVIGVDFSRRFIDAANTLRDEGRMEYMRADEGALMTSCVAVVPPELDRSRVRFETGDAMDLRADLGEFDVVLMANLIDRLADPSRCLARLAGLVKPGAQLIITSPYTWLEEFTPRQNWLGGFESDGRRVTTREGLEIALAGDFRLTAVRDLPFLIREHARKFQWSVAEATMWERR